MAKGITPKFDQMMLRSTLNLITS